MEQSVVIAIVLILLFADNIIKTREIMRLNRQINQYRNMLRRR